MSAIRAFLHIDEAIARYHAMPARQIVFVLIAVLMVVGGNAGQLLILNLWVNGMGAIPPAFTVLTLSATTMAVGFVTAIAIRKLFYPAPLSFLLSVRGLVLSVIIGLCNASNGVLLVYATYPTPEFMQALLLCTQVFWTLLFSRIVIRDRRSVLSLTVLASFLLVAGGIVLGASPQFSDSSPTTSKTKYWTLIFAASMIPGALYNVFASMYMRSFTRPKQVEEDLVANAESQALNYYKPLDTDVDLSKSDDTTVKLTMLATTGIFQVMWMFVFLPIDSAPFFDSAPSIAVTRENLKMGWECVLQRKYGCQTVYAYYIGFNVSYFLNYVGSAYLNHFSATLNSMVTQLSAPIAAIVLLIFPTLNVQAQAVSIGPSIGAIIMLLIGSVIYALWEQGTRRHA